MMSPAVGLIGPGGWRHEFAVGVADAASGRPLEPGALLPVASIGKAMTAVALLREHDAGRVGLDDPVHRHLPWLPLPTPFGPGRLETGVGVTALGNGPWQHPTSPASAWAVVDHGLALLRAAALGLDLPADPPPAAPASSWSGPRATRSP
jgi:hypothetical protein